MKKVILFVALALGGLESNAQLGGWFKWSNKDYVPSSHQYAVIVDLINQGLIIPGKWYKFDGSENRYQVCHPREWRNLLARCYGTDTLTLVDDLENTDDVDWGDDVSETTLNYYFSQDGTIKYITAYSGAAEGVPIGVFDGHVRYKRNCGNPNMPPHTFKPKIKPPQQPAEEYTKPVYEEPYKLPTYQTPPPQKDTGYHYVYVKRNNKWIWYAVGGIGAGILAYEVFHHHGSSDNGGPGGAPITPDPPGGPGGAGLVAIRGVSSDGAVAAILQPQQAPTTYMQVAKPSTPQFIAFNAGHVEIGVKIRINW